LRQSFVRDFKIVLGAGNFSLTKGFLDRIECNLSLLCSYFAAWLSAVRQLPTRPEKQ